MRVRDQRPIIVDQRSIRPPDTTTGPSNTKERPNACDGLRSRLTSQMSSKSKTTAPTTNAPLLRSDFCISSQKYNSQMCNPSGKFYKGRMQEKTRLLRLEFFLLLSPLDGARSVLTDRAICSVAGPCDPAVWVFSTSGFHRFFATKPVSSETNKAERGQIWRP